MVIGVDIDGTADAYPRQMRVLMQALRQAGHEVHVVTGSSLPEVTGDEWRSKAAYLASLDLADCYDRLAVVAGPEAAVPQRKAVYLRSVGGNVLIDNSEANARACSASGILVLVPWATRL